MGDADASAGLFVNLAGGIGGVVAADRHESVAALRQRIGHGAWRVTHWLAYACWPIALLHSLGTGSAVKSTWLLALALGCLGLVLAAVLASTLSGWSGTGARARGAALGGGGAFTVGLLLWLPGGPLGTEWARRSGTPAALLGHGGSHARATGAGQ